MEVIKKPHVVLVPAPHQGHINPIYKLAKLLHSKGFYITFVHTEFNFTRLITNSLGSDYSSNLADDFLFETIPDGLPPDSKRGVNDIVALSRSFHVQDESDLTNGYLDTLVDCSIPGLMEGAQLKHLSSSIRVIGADDQMMNIVMKSARNAVNAGNIIINTFDDLEGQVIEGIKTKIPNVCTIGPLSLLCEQANVHKSGSILWEEDTKCLDWLDKRDAKSVIYVNYGSLTTLSPPQLEEFAWGLANSNRPFLWIIRDDLVHGETGIMNEEYMDEIKERGFVSGWCPQENVLKHSSVAVFLTHCGWNSMLESISEGVPMICWPFIADQLTNCLHACKKWKVGMELGEGNVDRGRVEEVVREMMEGERGREISQNALEWKNKAEKAIKPGGSSHLSLDNLVSLIMEN